MKQTINIALTVEFMDEDVYSLACNSELYPYKEYIEEKVDQVVDNVENSCWCDCDAMDWSCINIISAELIKE